MAASGIPYSPKKVDLFYPARGENFFQAGEERTEAGLCAEMARLAYCRREPDFYFDEDQISDVLGKIGFTCRFLETKGTPGGEGTHCFLAMHDDANPARKLAVASFRGTDSTDPTDLVDDADLIQVDWSAGGRVHAGFAHAFEDVRADLLSALESISCRLLITGHSLGAAIATLLASLRKPDHLYTIGSPRVGNQAFVTALNGVHQSRFVNCCDMVARLPPPDMPLDEFAHFGPPYYIHRNRQLTLNPAESFMRDDRLQAAAEYILKYGWIAGNVAVRELADHAPINYVTAIAAAPANN